MGEARADGLRVDAAAAVDLFGRDRAAAADLAASVVERNDGADATAELDARWVLANAALASGLLDDAAAHADAAERAARSSGRAESLGRALALWVGITAQRGDPERALEYADLAEPLLDGLLRARVRMNRATVLALGMGRYADAIAEYDRLEHESHDLPPDLRAALFHNRGMQHLHVGDLDRAQQDIEAAAQLYRDLGNVDAALEEEYHRALVAARRADHPAVFEIHHRIAADSPVGTSRNPHNTLDLALALAASGLRREARAEIGAHLDSLDDDRDTEAAVHLALLDAELLGRDRPAAGVAAAQDVAARGRTIGHRALEVRAEAVACSLGFGSDRWTGRRARHVLTIAGSLASLDLRDEAAALVVDAADAAVAGGEPSVASVLLDAAPTTDGGRTSPPGRQALGHHRRALRAMVDGDRRRARAEIRRGLELTDRMRRSYASADLRAAASDRAPQLAALGLRLAIQARHPRSVLAWAERGRAAALRLSGEFAPIDRRAMTQLDALRREPSAASAGTHERTAATLIRSERSETGTVDRTASVGDICAACTSGAALVEYVEIDGRVDAVLVEDGRARLVDIGLASDEARDLISKLCFGLRRMSGTAASSASGSEQLVAGVADRLDRLLVEPLACTAPDVTVVPTGALHHLPWAALPTLHDRCFAVVPSAHVWLKSKERRQALGAEGDRVCVAAGPGLPQAAAELESVVAAWAAASPVADPAVTGSALGQMLGAADVAHVISHGHLRADNPLFSAFDLVDGPYFVHDLARVGALPATVVLSACSLGDVEVLVGDEVLGFPSALFELGTSALVASMLPVEDGASRRLMTAFHARLAAGDSPSLALLRARTERRGVSAADTAAAASFVCFGAG